MKKALLGIGGTVSVIAGFAIIWNLIIPFIMNVFETFQVWKYFM